MERFDSAFRIQSSYLSLTTIHYFLQHFRVFLLVYMIIYVDWIVSKLWLFDKRDNTLLTRLYLVDEKSGEKCVHVYETYNGKLVRRSQRESLNFLIQKFEEKYNKFDVQPWTKENDTSRNLDLVRVYRNIHLIVMDHLSKGDLLFLRIRRETYILFIPSFPSCIFIPRSRIQITYHRILKIRIYNYKSLVTFLNLILKINLNYIFHNLHYTS